MTSKARRRFQCIYFIDDAPRPWQELVHKTVLEFLEIKDLYGPNSPRRLQLVFRDHTHKDTGSVTRDPSNPTDRITIPTSTRLVLFDKIVRLLFNSPIFSDVGVPPRETTSDVYPNGLPTSWEDLAASLPESGGDTDRISYACDLADLSVLFIVFHEITHLTQGHLALMEEGQVSERDFETMELFADKQAAAYVAGMVSPATPESLVKVGRAILVANMMTSKAWSPRPDGIAAHRLQQELTGLHRVAGRTMRYPDPIVRFIHSMGSIVQIAEIRSIEWSWRHEDLWDLADALEQLVAQMHVDRGYVAERCGSEPLLTESLEYWQRSLRNRLEPHALLVLPTAGPEVDEFYE